MPKPGASLTAAIKDAAGGALCAYVVGGYPSKDVFPEILEIVLDAADIVEIGIPFSDPMADGLTIQQASHQALAGGVTLDYIIGTVGSIASTTPHVLMGYYNPFLAFGLDRLAERMKEAGTAGLIVPDLPLEESRDLVGVLENAGLGLIQLVAPTTPDDRLEMLAAASRGFVYAVSARGTTGGATVFGNEVLEYLDRVKSVSRIPVLAGFGVRDRAQVEALSGHVDGVVVGSALIDAINRGDDPGTFLDGLKASPS